MASPNTQSEKSTRQELREDRLVTLYARAWSFFEENRGLVYGVLAGLVVLTLLIIGYVFYQNQQQAEAERHLSRIISVYEQGDYERALQGTGDRMGLEEIANEYSRTRSGNLATYYTADAYYRLGQYDEALEYFNRYNKDRNILGASAIAAEASIYEDRGEYERAGDRYRRAGTYYESQATSPRYLMLAGRAYEEAGLYDRAQEAYELVQERYPDSPEAAEVDEHLARVEAKRDVN